MGPSPAAAGVFHPDFSGFGAACVIAWLIKSWGCEHQTTTWWIDHPAFVVEFLARLFPSSNLEPL
jgi:hypothetical protein